MPASSDDYSAQKHAVQAREQREPFERTEAAPSLVLALAVMLVLWAICYIAFMGLNDEAELGDRRTLSSLRGSAISAPNAVADGAQVFASQCVACHQATGLGLPGAFPPLTGSEWVNGSPNILTRILLQGVQGKLTVAGKSFVGVMPAFKDKLNDAEIAAVLSHIRSQWGNSAPVVDVALVANARKATANRTDPWNGDIELNSLPRD